MSTKTTFKRIALVTVATLGLGVLSVAPSSAVVNSDVLTVSSATATQSTGETATATSVTATLSFLAGAQYDSMSVVASLVSGPSSSTALPYIQLVETTSAIVEKSVAGTRSASVLAESTSPNEKAAVMNSASTAAQVSAKFKVFLGTSVTAGPTVDGTYVVKLTPALYSGTTGGGNATAQTITFTVAKSVVNVATSATVILNRGETDAALVDDVVTASKAALKADGSIADAAATIKVSLLNALGTSAIESYTATITGPGTLGTVASNGMGTQATVGRAISVQYNKYVQVLADGTAGVATVTISTASGTVVGTKTVTFYGAATAITAKTAALTTGTIAKVAAATNKLVSFKVVDASGVEVTTGSYYLVSNDTTKITNSYTACNEWNATDGFTCSVTGGIKGTASVYVTNKPSATDTTVTTVIKSNDVSIRVGTETVASVSVTTDKTSYAPGEKISLKVTLKDADGNPVVSKADYTNIFAEGGIVASYALGAASDTTTATSVLAAIDGVKTYTLYAPNTQATIKFEWTTGTNYAVAANQAVDGSLSVTVADSALEAANSATTAALAANDAVDALAATVAKLVANLKAQITALTKLIVKIQKKVGA